MKLLIRERMFDHLGCAYEHPHRGYTEGAKKMHTYFKEGKKITIVIFNVYQ